MKYSELQQLNVAGYRVEYGSELPDMDSAGLVLRHEKSGARICVISNEDENKVFCVGFRTPPFNSTGVPHIIEHTVLCGSEHFPLKDPFIELAKGSLNTFLNAMTYPDKTIYPIASYNDKDFQNLMHVYMDAVFYPNIYKYEEIFKQEGWHYELESPEAELSINGVVYSEMKGAYSSPTDVLFREIQAALFPDTAYGTESGGDPDVIPQLTYEEYLDFHRRYYHPSNSYIYLYGNMDVAEKLTWLDHEYLSHFTNQPVDSALCLQTPFGKRIDKELLYPIGEQEETAGKTFLSYNAVIGSSLDVERCIAWDVLESVLFSAPGAPVKQALLDAGIGKDILTMYDSSILQPVFTVVAKEADEDKRDAFFEVIENELKKQVAEGLNKNSLLAAINSQEFRYREADYGSTPKGLITLIRMFCTWLYDDTAAFPYCSLNAIYTSLREKVDSGYFERLIEEDLLGSKHTASVTLLPSPGLAAKKEAKLKEELAAYKASLSKEEIEDLVAATAKLRAYQEAEEDPAAIDSIPLLQISDIEPKVADIFNTEHEADGVKIVHHEVFTNGIAYFTLCFPVEDIPEEYLPYVGLLSAVLGNIDTAEHSYLELANEINQNTGGIAAILDTFSKKGKPNGYTAMFALTGKTMYGQMEKALSLACEMVTASKFSDTKRLKEIVGELCSRLQAQITSGGHRAAVSRVLSYFCEQEYFQNQTAGIGFYQFLKELSTDFDARANELSEKLSEVLAHIVKKETLFVSLTCDKEGYGLFASHLPAFGNGLSKVAKAAALPPAAPIKLTKKNEGFLLPGQVQYLARGGNFYRAGLTYTGALKVTRTILSLEYLWMNIRVKGGAYGCMCDFAPISGNAFFASYRDPNLRETKDVYENAAEYIETLTLDERELTKYIIGTISDIDVPLTPKMKGERSFNMYMTGYTVSDLQKERDEILGATCESLRKTAEVIRAFVGQEYTCVLGSETKVEECKDMFLEIKPLG